MKRAIDLPGNRDIVFPKLPFGRHLREHTWTKAEFVWGASIVPEIKALEEKTHLLEIFSFIAMGVTVGFVGFIWRQKRVWT